jgi:hypothetical protein
MDWCVIELPQIGYLGVKADGGVNTEFTDVAIRLAPRPGVTAAWTAAELRVLDVDSKAVKDMAALNTQSVAVRDAPPAASGADLVFATSHSQSDFVLRPRIKRFELQFPDVRSGDSRAKVQPVQIVDGVRFPMPVPWFLAGH